MRVGEFRIRLFRVLQYVALFTAPSILLTFVKVYGGRWYWVLLVVPFILLAWFLDPKLYRGETDYGNKNNEEWQKHLRDTEEMLRLLNEQKEIK